MRPGLGRRRCGRVGSRDRLHTVLTAPLPALAASAKRRRQQVMNVDSLPQARTPYLVLKPPNLIPTSVSSRLRAVPMRCGSVSSALDTLAATVESGGRRERRSWQSRWALTSALQVPMCSLADARRCSALT